MNFEYRLLKNDTLGLVVRPKTITSLDLAGY